MLGWFFTVIITITVTIFTIYWFGLKSGAQLDADLFWAAKYLSVVLMDYPECSAGSNLTDLWVVLLPLLRV